MKTISNLLLILSSVLLSGCATGRFADLKDIGRFSVGVGVGLEVNAKVGLVTQPSVGLVGSSTKRVGHESRNLTGTWQEDHIVWPVSFLVAGLDQATSGSHYTSLANHSVNRCIHGYSWGIHGDDIWTYWLPVATDDPYIRDSWFHELTDLEIDGTLGFVCLRIGVNPLEIVDFVLGFVGLDIAKDDPKEEKEKPTKDSTVPPEGTPSDVQ